MTDQDKLPLEEVGVIDEVNRLVQELWLESPGLGIRQLHQQVQERLSSKEESSVSKQRIKTAKALLPYRFCNDDNDGGDGGDTKRQHERHDFIVQKIQERQSLRALRRFEEADHIHRGLKAMGVEIDDILKSWKMGEPKTATAEEEQIAKSSSSSLTGVKCELCGIYFASRNLVFKHLRDPASGCGTSIFAWGKQIPDAPSSQKKNGPAIKALPIAPGRTARHAPAAHSIWVGDLPLDWSRPTGQYKRLRALLFAHLPRNIPEPWIRKVVRKAYRSRETSEYLGYAITVFRDEREATAARTVLNGKHITSEHTLPREESLTSFTLRARPGDKGASTLAAVAWSGEEGDKGNRDPPLEEQLRPLNLSQLRQRISQLDECAEEAATADDPVDNTSYLTQHQMALEKLVSLMKPHPRRQVHSQGRPIPDSLALPLTEILQNLRWPAKNDRPRLTSERYFVLPTNVTNDRFFGDLREACRALMDWAAPDYYYSGIAVTHNFVSSPHIDEKDCNYQYAVALGDFSGGGQLCVESQDEGCVEVVTTKNRIARVDGRRVHWVRPWEKGDRYSLIFYDTRDQTTAAGPVAHSA
eukprot:scaffold34630_cov185-Amphora_coffeaeformis.AAC.12